MFVSIRLWFKSRASKAPNRSAGRSIGWLYGTIMEDVEEDERWVRSVVGCMSEADQKSLVSFFFGH